MDQKGGGHGCGVVHGIVGVGVVYRRRFLSLSLSFMREMQDDFVPPGHGTSRNFFDSQRPINHALDPRSIKRAADIEGGTG
jgi:hypothetical protein